MRDLSEDREPMKQTPAASPRFGRLLVVLALVVLLIVGITFVSERYFA